MKHFALGTFKFLTVMICGPDNLSQNIYHEVYLSSKGPTDCAVDIEADRQTVDGGEVNHMIRSAL